MYLLIVCLASLGLPVCSYPVDTLSGTRPANRELASGTCLGSSCSTVPLNQDHRESHATARIRSQNVGCPRLANCPFRKTKRVPGFRANTWAVRAPSSVSGQLGLVQRYRGGECVGSTGRCPRRTAVQIGVRHSGWDWKRLASGVIQELLSHGCPGMRMRHADGSEDAGRGWPWMTSLQVEDRHLCSGSLINERWVMTAAQCSSMIPQTTTGDVLVTIGSRSAPESGGVIRKVKRMILHPSYTGRAVDYDVMLVELDQPISSSKHTRPVCLAERDFRPSQECIVGGWGLSGDVPRRVTSRTEPAVNCTDQSGIIPDDLNPSLLCSRNLRENGPTSCILDTGGPLMCSGERGWRLVGVTSRANGCGPDTSRAVYSDVTQLRSWISNTIHSQSIDRRAGYDA